MKKFRFVSFIILMIMSLCILCSCRGSDGPQGEQGIQGEVGPEGKPGKDGEDGHTPVINIGENGNDKWYYYDATRLAGSFGDGSNSACLITQDTLNSHKTSGGATDFYLMTKAPAYLDFSSAGGINSLPAIAKEKIN